MLTIPISFFQSSNSGHTWFLRRRHKALKPRFEKVLSAFLHIVVQNFRNNRCWSFQFHSSKLLNPATIVPKLFGQRCEEMLTKPSQSVVSVLYAFGTETTFGRIQKLERTRLEWSTFIVAKILDNDVRKCWQNLLKARIQCSMHSAQTPSVAENQKLEELIWKGQHL